MSGFTFSTPGEPFAATAERLNLLARVIGAQEWVTDGNYDEANGLLADLEGELRKAIDQNKRRELRWAA